MEKDSTKSRPSASKDKPWVKKDDDKDEPDPVKSDENNDDTIQKDKAKKSESGASESTSLKEQNKEKNQEIKEDESKDSSTKIVTESTTKTKLDIGTSDSKSSSSVQDTKLFDSIKNEILSEQTQSFSEHDTTQTQLIFTTLTPGKFTINGQLFTVVKGQIPTLFQFIAYWDAALADSNPPTIAGTGPILTDAAPSFIKESIDMVKDGTYSVKLELNPKGYEVDFNKDSGKNFYEQVVVVGSNTDNSTIFMEISKRLRLFFRLVRASNMVVQSVVKAKIGEVDSSNLVYKDRRNIWNGDNAHPYFGLLFHPIKWFKDVVSGIVQNAPIETGEFEAISDGNQKVESKIGCITDQFTAAILARTKRRIDNNVMTPLDFAAIVQAHTHILSDIRLVNPSPSLFEKYVNPSGAMWNASMVRLISDCSLRNDVISKMATFILRTNTFNIGSTSGFFSTVSQGTKDQYSVILSIFPAVGKITLEAFVRLFLLEHFSWAYEITWMTANGIDFESQLFELFSMMCTFIFFPKTVQAGSPSYGYRIMKIIQSINPVKYNELVEAHGAIVRMDSDDRFRQVTKNIRTITMDQAHSGEMVSIFDPAVSRNSRLPSWMRSLSSFYNRSLSLKTLDRKRRAGLPYTYDDYRAYNSWDADVSSESEKTSNSYPGRFQEAIKIIREIMVSRQGQRSDDKSFSSAKRGAFQTLINHFNTISTTSSSLMFTMATVSDIIQNSFGYVHEGYETRHTMMVPQKVTLGPYYGSKNESAHEIYKEKVSVESRVGATLLIAAEGGTHRPKITNENVAGTYSYEEENKKREILPIPAVDFAKFGVQLALDSHRFNEAMNILRFVVSKLGDSDEEVTKFTAAVKYYLQMRTFSEIIDELASVFNVNLRGVLGDIRFGLAIGQYRAESLMLGVVDRDTGFVDDIPDTEFGRRINWTDDITDENIRMAADLMLSDYSPANYSSTGLIISNVAHEIISPRTVLPVPKLEVDYTTNTLRRVNTVRSSGIAFFLNAGQLDEVRIDDPMDERLSGLMLKVDYFGDIAQEHINFITKSISYGRMSVKAVKQQYSYTITYHQDSAKPIYQSFEPYIIRVLSSKRGEYVPINFFDSTYAIKVNRFSSSILQQRGLFFPIENIKTNEIINGIYDNSAQNDEFQMNNGDQLGIGFEGKYMPISEVPKLHGEPNMNNFIPVYSGKVTFLETPEIIVQAPGFT